MRVPDMHRPDYDRSTREHAPPAYPGEEITGEVFEWVKACEQRKKARRTLFLSHSDYLQVALSLGYRKQPRPETPQ